MSSGYEEFIDNQLAVRSPTEKQYEFTDDNFSSRVDPPTPPVDPTVCPICVPGQPDYDFGYDAGYKEGLEDGLKDCPPLGSPDREYPPYVDSGHLNGTLSGNLGIITTDLDPAYRILFADDRTGSYPLGRSSSDGTVMKLQTMHFPKQDPTKGMGVLTEGLTFGMHSDLLSITRRLVDSTGNQLNDLVTDTFSYTLQLDPATAKQNVIITQNGLWVWKLPVQFPMDISKIAFHLTETSVRYVGTVPVGSGRYYEVMYRIELRLIGPTTDHTQVYNWASNVGVEHLINTFGSVNMLPSNNNWVHSHGNAAYSKYMLIESSALPLSFPEINVWHPAPSFIAPTYSPADWEDSTPSTKQNPNVSCGLFTNVDYPGHAMYFNRNKLNKVGSLATVRFYPTASNYTSPPDYTKQKQAILCHQVSSPGSILVANKSCIPIEPHLTLIKGIPNTPTSGEEVGTYAEAMRPFTIDSSHWRTEDRAPYEQGIQTYLTMTFRRDL